MVHEFVFTGNPGFNPETSFRVRKLEIKGLWEELKIQIFYTDVVIHGELSEGFVGMYHKGQVKPIAPSFGGSGLLSGMMHDGGFYFTYSMGSGIHRSHVAMLRLVDGKLKRWESGGFMDLDLFVSLDSHDVKLLAEIELEKILNVVAAEKPQVAVIDSIQTVYSAALTSAPGSVAQVRECAAHLTRMAKSSGTTLILVGHVTKEGALAGPRVLEHMVDTVLYFEGDTHSSFRLIRAVKNRFGAVNEIGVFAMTEKGLREVTNPSAIFLSQHDTNVSGSCVMVTQEGSRPLLVEIQALVDDSHGMNPKRLSVGLEQNRLAMLLAVLHRHGGLAVFDQDVFINAVGGVRIDEPGADLAVLLAIVSSFKNKPLPAKHVVFGETGLAGEVRPVQRGHERLREAAKLGFTHAIVPKANTPKHKIEGMEVIGVDRVEQAVEYCRG